MPRVAKTLSARAIAQLPVGRHAVGGVAGLYVAVGADGTRRWLLRRYLDGKQREIALGDDVTTLALAREAAAILAQELADGPALQRPAPALEDNPFLGPIGRHARDTPPA